MIHSCYVSVSTNCDKNSSRTATSHVRDVYQVYKLPSLQVAGIDFDRKINGVKSAVNSVSERTRVLRN